MVLPLLVLPFVTMTFWALGGGKGKSIGDAVIQQGINTELPEAQVEDGTLDKMSLYGRKGAEQDVEVEEPNDTVGEDWDELIADYDAYGGYSSFSESHSSEQRLRQRLDELERIIAMQEMAADNSAPPFYEGGHYSDPDPSLQRLELMMQRMAAPSEPDPELRVLDGMLEKIMDIQNPERAREKMMERSAENRGVAYPISRQPRKDIVPLIRRATAIDHGSIWDTSFYDVPDELRAVRDERVRNGFHGLATQTSMEVREVAGIPAMVHETQTVVNGAELKMRLTEDIYVNGILIPAGHSVTGICDLNGERLQVKVPGIQYGNYQLPVSLTVFDRDGLEGIRIPGAISRDAAKEGSDRAIQGIQFMSMDPSLLAQATGAGIEAAKGLFSRKVRLIKVTVKAGHPVLLHDEQSNRQ